MRYGKLHLAASIFELIVGVLAVVSFALIVGSTAESAVKWIGALILAVVFIIMGIAGIIAYCKDKKRQSL